MKRPTDGLKHARGLAGWQKGLIAAACAIVCLAVALSGAYFIMKEIGRSKLQSQRPTEIDEDAIVYNGETYVYNDKLTSVLFIGTDRLSAKALNEKEPGANGQADALYLAVIDTETGKINVLGIARDIMTDVRVFSVGGQYLGTEKKQVCLAFAYGDGREKSCENTVNAVSNLLYGIDIGTYFCLDWANIGQLNDLVGGVEVPEYDENWKKTGRTVSLTGDDVRPYLRGRDKTILDSSVNRMNRQIDYLNAFAAKTTKAARADITAPLRLYNELNSVSVNNLDATKITYLTTLFLNGGARIEFSTLTGKMVQGEQYAEMYLDDKTTYETLLKIFYKKK